MEGSLTYHPPSLVSHGLHVFFYVLWLNVGVFGDHFAEFGLELGRLVDIPGHGLVIDDLHGYCNVPET